MDNVKILTTVIKKRSNRSGWVFRKHAGQLYFLRRRLSGEKTVWKAERAWFLDRRERRAKPGIEPLLTRWGKSGVFLNHSAAASQTVFLNTQPDLSFIEDLVII
jgi:hypothetical protein